MLSLRRKEGNKQKERKKMKVVYVVPNWKKHDTLYTTVSLNIPHSMPLEYMYIDSMLDSEIESEVIDANVLDLSYLELKERIMSANADALIFNTTVNYILWRCPPVEFEVPKKLMKICADMDILTIAIGPHSSVDAEEVYRELNVDYLIVGEPEVALSRFINSKFCDMSIRGLYGKGIDNGIADEVKVDELPIPNFFKFNIDMYDAHAWSSNTKVNLEKNNLKGTILEYSRGCVFHCPYCFRKGFRDRFRVKTISQIEKEIIAVKALGIRYIYFIDEIFNIDNSEWRELLFILKREEMYFGCQARPDIMTYEMISLMKDAGCVYIEYGVESFSEEVLGAINKSLDKQKLLRILAFSYQQFGKENVELGMINFYTKDVMEILNLKQRGRWNAKVVRPYPNSMLGDEIYKMYDIREHKWEFLTRYIWWSQIENYEVYLGISSNDDIKAEILFGTYENSKQKSYELISKYLQLTKEREGSVWKN